MIKYLNLCAHAVLNSHKMANRRLKTFCYKQKNNKRDQGLNAGSCIIKRKIKNKRSKTKYSKKMQSKIKAASRHIMNLSSYELKKNEILILGKGMKFIPTPKSNNAKNLLMKDVNEYIRKLRCRFHYFKSDERQLHPFYTQTGHTPPMANNSLEHYIDKLKYNISEIQICHNKTVNNISKDELYAIKNLAGNSSIHIKKQYYSYIR